MILLCLLPLFLLTGQDISHEVLVPVASVVKVGNYYLSQTIGEPVVDYLRTDSYDLTQGFQQPGISIIDDIEPPAGSGVNVYPNPVVSDLKIELFGTSSKNFDVVIFSINGTIFFRKTYICEGHYWRVETINMQDFKRGMYFVRIRSIDDQIVRLFKIEKM